jgi:2-hydroxymuconate-semialdehyde hydrolase
VNADRDQMLAGTGAVPRTLDIGRVATTVLEAGAGVPLVLLHGGIECGGIMWTPVLRALSQQYRVIVPDVPGLGESAPVARLDVPTFAEWFRGLLDATDAEAPTVVAHSLTGSLTARFAITHGHHIGRLVVYGAPGVGPYRIPWRLKYVAIRFTIRPSEANAERFDRFALLDYDATRARDPAWFDAFARYTRERASLRHVKRTMTQLIRTQTRPIPPNELDRIATPTSLLWGGHDRMVPIRIGEIAAARHGWPLHVVEDVAHAPHIERPDRFVEALEAARLAT